MQTTGHGTWLIGPSLLKDILSIRAIGLPIALSLYSKKYRMFYLLSWPALVQAIMPGISPIAHYTDIIETLDMKSFIALHYYSHVHCAVHSYPSVSHSTWQPSSYVNYVYQWLPLSFTPWKSNECSYLASTSFSIPAHLALKGILYHWKMKTYVRSYQTEVLFFIKHTIYTRMNSCHRIDMM